jgi:SAM-dependent methyltransferase
MMYRFGWRPWDFDTTPIEFEEVVAELKPGRALGLGCRSGRQAVELAQRGWSVTVLDDNAGAVVSARRNANAANVDVTFQLSDVAQAGGLDVEGDFDLLYDIDCFQQVPIGSRPDYERNVSRAAREGAAYVLLAVAPSFLWRSVASAKGVDFAEVESLFGSDFQVVSQRAAHDWPFGHVCYWMRRNTQPRSDSLNPRSVL